MASQPYQVCATDELEFSASDDPIAMISERILKEAYQKLGIRMRTRILPAERALRHSNSGQCDGEINRIRQVNKKYKNLVLVPIEINYLEGVAFAKYGIQPIKNWQSLKSFSIGQ